MTLSYMGNRGFVRRALFEEYGEAGLKPAPRRRSVWSATEELGQALSELLGHTPKDRVYLRSRWSSERLVLVLGEVHTMEDYARRIAVLRMRNGTSEPLFLRVLGDRFV